MNEYTDFDELMPESDRLIREGESICTGRDIMNEQLDSIEVAIQKLSLEIEKVRLERVSYSLRLWDPLEGFK